MCRRFAYHVVAALGIAGCVVTPFAFGQSCPELVGQWTLGTAHDVAVSDDYAYVVDSTTGLWMIDVSIPAAPVEVALVATPLWVVLDELVVTRQVAAGTLPAWLAGGLLPVAVGLAIVLVFQRWVTRRSGATHAEAVQVLFVLVWTAFLVLTATGVWFRGEGMALTWPWGS